MRMYETDVTHFKTEIGEGQGSLRGIIITEERYETTSESEILRGQSHST